MKAQELSGEHLGRRITVDTKDLVIAGTLAKVIHTTIGVSLSFRGSISIQVKPEDEVELLE
jgi:hypothetical protein